MTRYKRLMLNMMESFGVSHEYDACMNAIRENRLDIGPEDCLAMIQAEDVELQFLLQRRELQMQERKGIRDS